jgi:hypothetical protein
VRIRRRHAVWGLKSDRGFARALFIAWLQQQHLDHIVRVPKGTSLTTADGERWKLGEEHMQPGEERWHPQVRYTLYHGRPRGLWVHVVLS